MLPSNLFVAACLSLLPSLVWAQGGRVDPDATREAEIKHLESRIDALERQVEELGRKERSSEGKIDDIETRSSKLERDVHVAAGGLEIFAGDWRLPPLMVLSGVVCALWAQATRRRSWLWFLLGSALTPIAWVLMLRNGWDAGQPGVAR